MAEWAGLARGFVLAAPHSGSGKTLVTLGLLRALTRRGVAVAPAKTGPDYIDPAFLSRAAGTPTVNLDPFAMTPPRLKALAGSAARDAKLLVVEGVMGLFDGAAGGGGSTADLAAALGLPVVLVIDCARMAQSVAAIAQGFAGLRADVQMAGVILNKVASDRHEAMLRGALHQIAMPVIGVVRRDDGLTVPDRHLGLILPGEVEGIEAIIEAAADAVEGGLDFDRLEALAAPVPDGQAKSLPPLGQRIAIARDACFAFTYEHWLRDWRARGAEMSFFSPLADEAPAANADAIYLPGGYPELHGQALEAATGFRQGLMAARDRGALIYGECGGYMVLGRAIIDRAGNRFGMTGLLPHETAIDAPRRILGYRRITHRGPLHWGEALMGHEFHYSRESSPGAETALFTATDATGNDARSHGGVDGRVCGSYLHVIDAAREGL
ncbi:cobyrinate a,c-diamide synthase [Cucumibacter marinus]|uniref:cobyrinate a,c-diamide synthase n=1 Tax=Cucumibacter marinus TaxID=1121252 RepID=UPI00048D5DAD|nr:cobyrinate a,c-diamide synthase [Cucumibacter marinus]